MKYLDIKQSARSSYVIGIFLRSVNWQKCFELNNKVLLNILNYIIQCTDRDILKIRYAACNDLFSF